MAERLITTRKQITKMFFNNPSKPHQTHDSITLYTRSYSYVNYGSVIYRRNKKSLLGAYTVLDKNYRKRLIDAIWNADQQGRLELHFIKMLCPKKIYKTKNNGKKI